MSGRWFAADSGDAEICRVARSVAKALKWPCNKVSIEDTEVPTSGAGEVAVCNGRLEAVGRVDLDLPQGTFDVETFRRLVAAEGGKLPPPPMSEIPAKSPNIVIPSLTYKRDFLDEEHERHLIEWIDQQAWSTELSRRVQHYGWRYDYGAREVDSSMRLGELPAELEELAERLYDRGLVPQMPDQVIVNEYRAGQGISPHVDARGFADGIAMISLLESWEMAFHAPRSKGGKVDKVPRLLERRSVAVMRGEARCKWKHEIAKRKSDPYVDRAGKSRRRERNRRISLTFRKVLPMS